MDRGSVSINPFLERGVRKVNSSMRMPACVVEDMGKVCQIGQEQYEWYKETIFVTRVANVLNTAIITEGEFNYENASLCRRGYG